MLLTGTLEKEDDGWIAEVASAGVISGGKTIEAALDVLCDMFRIKATRDGRALDGFKTTAEAVDMLDGTKRIHVRSNQPTRLAMIMVRHQRELRGLSHADVVERMGASSRNAYARYEQGSSEPSVAKFIEILSAVLPDFGLVLEPLPKGRSKRSTRTAA